MDKVEFVMFTPYTNSPAQTYSPLALAEALNRKRRLDFDDVVEDGFCARYSKEFLAFWLIQGLGFRVQGSGLPNLSTVQT